LPKQKKGLINTSIIETVIDSSSDDKISVRDLVEAMEDFGFGLVLLIFSFGVTIPLPPPFPSIISIPLVVFSTQMLFGYKSPKLPQKFNNLKVKRKVVALLLQKTLYYTGKAERFLLPRLDFCFTPLGERIIGGFSLAFAVLILLPMPLSNFIPGVGILIISLGILKKDGLAVILGILIGIIGMAVVITASILGMEFLLSIYHYLKSFFI
jgi:hypothetical protein